MTAPHKGKRAAFDGSFVLWGGGPIGRIDYSAWSSPGREAPVHGKGGERRWERARRFERGGERRWRDVHKRGGSVVCVAVCRPCPRSPVVARRSRGFSRHHSLQAGKKGLVRGTQPTCADVDRPERKGKYPEDAFPCSICQPRLVVLNRPLDRSALSPLARGSVGVYSSRLPSSCLMRWLHSAGPRNAPRVACLALS